MKNKGEVKEMYLAKKSAKVLKPLLEKYYRAKFIGIENIPDTPFLGIGNHLGVYFMPESFLWLTKYYSLKNKPPMKVLVHNALHNIAKFLVLPEKEFGILDANPKNAVESLKNGNSITVYPGGDRENAKPFSERNEINFYNHLGYIKSALNANVPILPIVGVGGGETVFVLSSGEKIAKKMGLTKLFNLHTWPIYWSFPFGWHVGHFPFLSLPLPSQVTLSVLPAYSLDEYTAEDANNPEVLEKINKEIIFRMQTELDRLAKGRIPIIGNINP